MPLLGGAGGFGGAAGGDWGLDPLELALHIEKKKYIKELIEGLPLREQQIITLYYFKDHTFKDIAKSLGLTESRISQLHSELKKMLRAKIKEAL